MDRAAETGRTEEVILEEVRQLYGGKWGDRRQVVARALLYMDATALGRDSGGRQPPFPLDGSPEMRLPLVMYQGSAGSVKTLPAGG